MKLCESVIDSVYFRQIPRIQMSMIDTKRVEAHM